MVGFTRRVLALVLLLVSASTSAACDAATGRIESSASSSGTAYPNAPAPEAACRDFIDAAVKLATRCMRAPEGARARVLAEVGGDCRNTVSIRDEAALRSECFGKIDSIDCRALDDESYLPYACAAQLESEFGGYDF